MKPGTREWVDKAEADFAPESSPTTMPTRGGRKKQQSLVPPDDDANQRTCLSSLPSFPSVQIPLLCHLPIVLGGVCGLPQFFRTAQNYRPLLARIFNWY